jgi:ribosomal protein L10
MTPVLKLWTVFTLLTLLTSTSALDATLQRFKESPGLYYNHIGEAQLYNTEWKLLTYIDLREADQNLESVKKYAQLSMEFCKQHEHTYWINITDCMKITHYMDRHIKEVEDLKSLVRQLTRIEEDEQMRFKRGIFNFIGGISKILFGTMDSEDASYYAEKISSLEKEQIDFLKLSKEQITVVKSTLRSLNSTLLAVSENERILSKGLDEMAKHVNERDGEIKEMFTGTSMLLTINEHSMQLERALDECRREYNILIDAVTNAQKGILQPHIVTPAQIMKQMKASQSDIPSELSLPIPMSATYQSLLVNIIDLDVFIKGNLLVYVIRLPLTNHINYNLYHVLPLPIKIKGSDTKFTFIIPEREYLLMDVAKRYYARLKVNEIKECKLINAYHRVCKQNNPVHISQLHEECEVEMLQSVRTIPSSCSQRIAEINQTIWTQLDNNEWLYVAPRPDVLTVLCLKQDPSDIEIVGTGKLILHRACKAYGARVLIQAQTIMTFNNTEKDVIPPLSLEYDCCISEGTPAKLRDFHLELPLKNIVNRLEDLRLASHKVEEVDRLIAEQEWKIKQSKFDFHLSFLSYAGMVTTSLVMILFCYCCCCKCCKRRFPNFSKWWKDNNPCTTIVIKPKIINSIHSSRESLRSPNTRTVNLRKLSQEDAIEETELLSLKPCGKLVIPSGKR